MSLVGSFLAFQEFLLFVKCIRFEHGIDNHKKFASHCDNRPLGICALLQPPIRTRQILLFVGCDDPGNFTQDSFEIIIALSDTFFFLFPGALMISGSQSCLGPTSPNQCETGRFVVHNVLMLCPAGSNSVTAHGQLGSRTISYNTRQWGLLYYPAPIFIKATFSRSTSSNVL